MENQQVSALKKGPRCDPPRAEKQPQLTNGLLRHAKYFYKPTAKCFACNDAH